MKDIAELSVTQVRLYPTDSLPFARICFAANLKVFREAFQFEQAQFDGITVTLERGTFQHDGRSILISTMKVEDRKLQIKILGKSLEADAFYSVVVPLLQSVDTREPSPQYEPLLKSEETACAATLDIDFDRLISPELVQFLRTSAMDTLRRDFAVPKSIGLRRLAFEIRYEPADPNLEEHNISVAGKLLQIEPRTGTPWGERRFFTVSPTDSETHLALLRSLETTLSGRKREKSE